MIFYLGIHISDYSCFTVLSMNIRITLDGAVSNEIMHACITLMSYLIVVWEIICDSLFSLKCFTGHFGGVDTSHDMHP